MALASYIIAPIPPSLFLMRSRKETTDIVGRRAGEGPLIYGWSGSITGRPIGPTFRFFYDLGKGRF